MLVLVLGLVLVLVLVLVLALVLVPVLVLVLGLILVLVLIIVLSRLLGLSWSLYLLVTLGHSWSLLGHSFVSGHSFAACQRFSAPHAHSPSFLGTTLLLAPVSWHRMPTRPRFWAQLCCSPPFLAHFRWVRFCCACRSPRARRPKVGIK